MSYQKTNVPGYLKDRKAGFVLNTNMRELQAYRTEVLKLKKMKHLEQELAEMKALVGKLLEEKS